MCKRFINPSNSDSANERHRLSDEEDSSNGSTTDNKEMTEVNQPRDNKETEFGLAKVSASKSVQYYIKQVNDTYATFKFLKTIQLP